MPEDISPEENEGVDWQALRATLVAELDGKQVELASVRRQIRSLERTLKALDRYLEN